MTTITITLENGQIKNVEITTERLFLRPINEEDRKNYGELFGNATNMENYGNGTRWEAAVVDKNFKMWLNRWNGADKQVDPLSAFAIFLQDDEDTFLGHVVLGHGKSRVLDGGKLEGSAELAIILHHEYWNHGYGREAVMAILKYALALNEKGLFTEEKKDKTIIPITQIGATYATYKKDAPTQLTPSAKIAAYIAETCHSTLGVLTKDEVVLYRGEPLLKTRFTIDIGSLRPYLAYKSEVTESDTENPICMSCKC